MKAFAAIDLGATSGRVILALLPSPPREVVSSDARYAVRTHYRAPELTTSRIELVEVGRFENGAVSVPVGAGVDLHWDVLHLWRGILAGLREAGRVAAERGATLAGIGVDSWAVDYGLIDGAGALVANPRCYRDPRYLDVADQVDARIPHAEQYAINGLQHLAFNTLYQLVANGDDLSGKQNEAVLLIPDLINYWLTGKDYAEVTNASTTGLLDARTRQWSAELAGRLKVEYPYLSELDCCLLAEVIEPGNVIAELSPAVQELTGLGPVPVIAVASHDTASAVVGTPLMPATPTTTAAYISSGTWSLVGLELPAPILTETSRLAGFTNELGADGTVRYLKNVMGLWVLDECRREWERAGESVDLSELLAAAAAEPPTVILRSPHATAPDDSSRKASSAQDDAGVAVIDLDDPKFLPPGDMPRRVGAAATSAGLLMPETKPALARLILDSLAVAYAKAITAAADLTGVTVTQVNVVGGGSLNALLCQLTADATGLPVVAGPVEAAALGNVLIQARTVGTLPPDSTLADLRTIVINSSNLTTYYPRT
ncbi:MAG: rhamnulokinase [Promicromonosporaceae bacterium]|nr:rhamnulokinase [Promicromonosporaceae bacterium]